MMGNTAANQLQNMHAHVLAHQQQQHQQQQQQRLLAAAAAAGGGAAANGIPGMATPGIPGLPAPSQLQGMPAAAIQGLQNGLAANGQLTAAQLASLNGGGNQASAQQAAQVAMQMAAAMPGSQGNSVPASANPALNNPALLNQMAQVCKLDIH